jgi:hypothetical protein
LIQYNQKRKKKKEEYEKKIQFDFVQMSPEESESQIEEISDLLK